MEQQALRPADVLFEAGPGAPRPLYSKALVYGVWIVTLFLAASAWFVADRLSERDRSDALLRAERDTANLTRVIAEQTTRAIAGSDHILKYIGYDLYRLGPDNGLLRDLMRNATFDSDLLLQLAYADAAGDLIQTSVDAAPPKVNLADREHFRVHKEGTVDGLFISKPVFGRASGRWSIQLSRKVLAPDGGFGGMIVASIDPFYFSRSFDDLNVGKQGIITIFGVDGVLRARSVMDEKTIGLNLKGGSLYEFAKDREEGFTRSTSVVDGVSRLLSFRRIKNYPLIVAAGFEEEEFMAEVAARRNVYYAGAGTAAVLLVGMALLVTGHAGAQERANAALDQTARYLRASRKKLHDIAETASDWFWETDNQYNFIEVSGAAGDGRGDPKSMIGRNYEQIAVRDMMDEQAWRAFRDDLAAHRPFRGFEFAVREDDGGVRLWSISGAPVFDDDGDFLGYRGSGSDVTLRRRAEQSLAQSEQRYRAMFEVVGQALVVADSNGAITGFNPAAEAFLGYGEAEMLGRSIGDLTPDYPLSDPAALFGERPAREGGGALAVIPDVTARRADGAAAPVEITLSRWSAHGEEQYLAVFHDISKAKRIEADLRGARDAAEHANRMKSQFLATISHEIRTPMNGVLGALTLMADRELPHEARRLTGVARSSAESLLSLLDDILDFAKLEAGKIAINEEVCSPARIMESVIAAVRPSAEKKHLQLSCRTSPTTPETAVTDPARLRQILFNLVGNAVKFTTSGFVEARLRRGEETADGGFMLEFEVEDTGIGISPQVLPTLFHRFTQADSFVNRRFGGTGLGLAICKELCELLGGDITVVSAPDRGSVFRFSIACASADAAADAAAERHPATAAQAGESAALLEILPPLTILAVDDNAVNLDILCGLLSRHGHTVVSAADGAEAVRLAATQRFDVVLMDVQMPEMDGLAATRAIRRLPAPYGTGPVIALTAHAGRDALLEYEASGMNGFVPKPIRYDKMITEIAAALGASPQAAPAIKATPVIAASQPPLLDIEQAQAICSGLGREDWNTAFEKFVETAKGRITEIKAAIEEGRPHQRAAHSLKGVAWNVGAKGLGDSAYAIEKLDCVEAAPAAAKLDEVLAATLKAFAETPLD
jgi:PAS domain S-box-containing protein